MQLTNLSGAEGKSFTGMDCSVAQCLEAVGQWWSLLILRDIFLGVTRFDEIQERLGISREHTQSAPRPPRRARRPGQGPLQLDGPPDQGMLPAARRCEAVR